MASQCIYQKVKRDRTCLLLVGSALISQGVLGQVERTIVGYTATAWRAVMPDVGRRGLTDCGERSVNDAIGGA